MTISKASLDIINKEIAGLEKTYGEGAVIRDGMVKTVPSISTGSFSLDRAIGVGGVPLGRTIEVFGTESSGKTTLCWNIIANAQKEGYIACMIDSENSADLDWAEKQGVNRKELFIAQPSCGEEAIDVAKKMINTGQVNVVIFDSAAAMIPKEVIEQETNKRDIAQLARMLSQELPKLQAAAYKNNVLCLWTNQVRDAMNMGGWGYQNPYVTPGGHALKFYASVRIECKESTKDGEKGRWFNATVVKNKVAPPFKKARFYIDFLTGIDRIYELWEQAKDKKVVVAAGAYFKFASDPDRFAKPQGTEGLISMLRNDEEYRNAIIEALYAKDSTPVVDTSRGQEFEEE